MQISSGRASLLAKMSNSEGRKKERAEEEKKGKKMRRDELNDQLKNITDLQLAFRSFVYNWERLHGFLIKAARSNGEIKFA